MPLNDLVFKLSYCIPSSQQHLSWVKNLTSCFLSDTSSPVSRVQNLAHRLTLATIEAVTNAIVHGNRNGESPVVEVDLILTEKWVEIKVRDTGPGFQLHHVPRPDIESCPTNGMGLHMIREIMTNVSLTRKDGTNELKMTKVF